MRKQIQDFIDGSKDRDEIATVALLNVHMASICAIDLENKPLANQLHALAHRMIDSYAKPLTLGVATAARVLSTGALKEVMGPNETRTLIGLLLVELEYALASVRYINIQDGILEDLDEVIDNLKSLLPPDALELIESTMVSTIESVK